MFTKEQILETMNTVPESGSVKFELSMAPKFEDAPLPKNPDGTDARVTVAVTAPTYAAGINALDLEKYGIQEQVLEAFVSDRAEKFSDDDAMFDTDNVEETLKRLIHDYDEIWTTYEVTMDVDVEQDGEVETSGSVTISVMAPSPLVALKCIGGALEKAKSNSFIYGVVKIERSDEYEDDDL